MEYFGKNKFLEELKEFIENKKNKIKIVAVPVLVIAAVLFFWLNSGSDEIKIDEAETVQDGQKIMIGRHGENPDENRDSYSANNVTDSGEGKVNINTADAAALQTIPGIGPSKADRIIEYRESEGKFNEIDDIKNISGIGNKTFESIKEYITV